jgi:cytochrome c553
MAGAAVLSIICSLSLDLPAAMAAGSAEQGVQKSITCAACHGETGRSVTPEWPHLAGQHEKYLIETLQDYNDRERQDVLMSGQASTLTDQDIEDLAAYFSSLPPAEGTADPALVPAGERLYRGGNKDTSVAACIACHGPRGRGNAPAAYPSVAGQHADYTAAQLRAYADSTRRSDEDQIMRNIAARLSEEEIIAVSSYIQGLR